MTATVAADFVFAPKVWADHVMAYFDLKLVYGAFAVKDSTLVTKPGLTVDFPYFKAIGAAQEPAEDESLNVDSLADDSFSATVKEIGKAVGIKKKAFYKSAASQDQIITEAQRQIGQRMAEKVDADLLTEFSTSGNYYQGYTATASGDTMNIRNILAAKMLGLGDRADEAQVLFAHSRQVYDLMADSTSGFLKADANDPMAMVQGFMGRILGMAVVMVDTIPANGSQIGGKDAYHAFIHTAAPYGLMVKQEPEMEQDKDILAREWVVAGTQWYAVKSFHSKIDAENKRTIRLTTTVSQ